MKSLNTRASMVLGAALLAPLFSLGAARPLTDGILAGQITFDGGPAPAGVVTSDAVVYLIGDALAGEIGEGPAPELDQSDIAFVPHVVTVVAGQEVKIHNSDAIMHNLNASSRKNRPFNKSQLGGMTSTVTFRVPEIVPVRCDVHSQMSAYIAVVPNRFFARPDASGAYRIEHVPPGTYQLVAWHEKYGSVTKDITVGDGQTVSSAVDFTSK